MKHTDCDFTGWGTRNGILCSDGRTILKDAFKDCDGVSVPLVWNHRHDSSDNVLGHALLENQPEGVRVYGYFNDTERGKAAREQVKHKDITNLSIFANNLKHVNGSFVSHGVIREVSLVLAGANPGAVIDYVLAHSEETEEAAFIYTDEEISLQHSEEKGENMDNEKKDVTGDAPKKEEPVNEESGKEKTVKEVFDSLNEDQKNLLYAMVAEALEEGDNNKNDDEGEKKEMKHNVFENENNAILMHQARKEFEEAVIKDAKTFGSMKESFMAHSEEFGEYLEHAIDTTGMDTKGEINRRDKQGPYGIGNLDFLFPDAKNLNNEPEMIKRDQEWVRKVMSGVHHSPFSRIKSVFANITEDEARAKGYITTHMKKNEVFALLKRSTSPTTVYKKQKMDRDDVIDITDFDVIAWLKQEMRMMLNEELARAFLIGDGRLPNDDSHIDPNHIRPIWTDADLYTIKKTVTPGADDAATAKNFIRAAIKSRKEYKGSGNPTLYCTEDLLTDMLLLEDGIGHLLYPTETVLATTLRVRKIVTVPVMENQTREGKTLLGIIVNLTDYNVGADKGGAVEMFDDFDLDYNQMQYLIETRCSGALIKPYSAIAFELAPSGNNSGT